jgi:uncharacterized damage-inducible protein DinB
MKLHHAVCLTVAVIMLAPAIADAQAADPVMASVRPSYERTKDLLMRSAEQLSEEEIVFQPTEEVRHALGLLGHIADSQHFYCSVALGESAPHNTEIEDTQTTREGMIQALRESFEYCDRAYAQSDAEALQPVAVRDGRVSRLSQLVANSVHNWEHYGNIVTYMRLLGKVPPSSQPRR